jgi:diaminopimelate decarboxylase
MPGVSADTVAEPARHADPPSRARRGGRPVHRKTIMTHFKHRNGALHAEDVPLSTIAAAVGTPAYVYSAAALRASARDFRAGLASVPRKHLAFAVKANPNLAVLQLLAKEGYGADIVSGGELLHALAAGMPASSIVFSGVGKSRRELAAALDAGVGQFNLELEEEGTVLGALAVARGRRAPAVLRVNPDVDAHTHAKISTGRRENKFGVALDAAVDVYARLAGRDGLALRGIAIHIGSQIADLEPLVAAYTRVGALIGKLRAAGHAISHVDLGGGLGVSYRAGDVFPTPEAYGEMVARVTRDWDVTLMFEPGRFIAGAAGVLLTEVLWVKPGAAHPYVIVDAAMNDLARPALYDAFHDFVAVRPNGARICANIAGPVCESGDTFAMARDIDAVGAGDLGVFLTAGAYGATMASTYNCRALVAEVLVDGDRFAVVADRITPGAMMAAQHVPHWLSPGDALQAA